MASSPIFLIPEYPAGTQGLFLQPNTVKQRLHCMHMLLGLANYLCK